MPQPPVTSLYMNFWLYSSDHLMYELRFSA